MTTDVYDEDDAAEFFTRNNKILYSIAAWPSLKELVLFNRLSRPTPISCKCSC